MTKSKQTASWRFFLPYLLAFRLELILSIIFGLASGITVVLMTYYIGLSVDQMVDCRRHHPQEPCFEDTTTLGGERRSVDSVQTERPENMT